LAANPADAVCAKSRKHNVPLIARRSLGRLDQGSSRSSARADHSIPGISNYHEINNYPQDMDKMHPVPSGLLQNVTLNISKTTEVR
jgi:hypothetical protein